MKDFFLTVRQLSSGTAQGLFEFLTGALNGMGGTGWEKRVIGLGCGECSADMGKRGG